METASTKDPKSQEETPESLSSTKRPREEDEKEQSDETKSDPTGSIISNGILDFPLSSIHNLLVCSLCSGYFKDPYTITECCHTFCKSCLFYAVACGCHECPDCKLYIGNDPLKAAVLDHALQDLLDRVVFPHFLKEEEELEKIFYAKRGIAMKPEFAQKQDKKTRSVTSATTEEKKEKMARDKQDELEFTLVPETVSKGNALPALDCPCLRVSGKLRMNQLKKYLFQKLDIPSALDAPRVDILCNGVPIGDEMSLSFVKRLVWSQDSDLALTYRLAGTCLACWSATEIGSALHFKYDERAHRQLLSCCGHKLTCLQFRGRIIIFHELVDL